MKNRLKKIATVLSAAALITIGAANVYAGESNSHLKGETAYDVFVELNKGNRIS